jgi:hypothetical protein
LIITISDTCKNQPKTLDFDNTINLSSLIVSLDIRQVRPCFCTAGVGVLRTASMKLGHSENDT